MATRDLHDQKILGALEGIEKQLSVQNKILKESDSEPHHTGVIRSEDNSFVKIFIPDFVNPDGTRTPLIPSKSIKYYICYTDNSGQDRTTVMSGMKLSDSDNAFILKMAKEILFCYEEGEK